ncbi:MAG: hypothetical protein CL608_03640 [Anaerolineaceae bacterium]|nr:hypothetical protein [Anaerolineaceae bacterium]
MNVYTHLHCLLLFLRLFGWCLGGCDGSKVDRLAYLIQQFRFGCHEKPLLKNAPKDFILLCILSVAGNTSKLVAYVA